MKQANGGIMIRICQIQQKQHIEKWNHTQSKPTNIRKASTQLQTLTFKQYDEQESQDKLNVYVNKLALSKLYMAM